MDAHVTEVLTIIYSRRPVDHLTDDEQNVLVAHLDVVLSVLSARTQDNSVMLGALEARRKVLGWRVTGDVPAVPTDLRYTRAKGRLR